MNWLWMLVGTYLLYATVMVVAHSRFIYPFGPDPFDDPSFTQEIVGPREVAMALSTGEDPVAVLFFMGNGGALAYFTFSLQAHQTAGRTVAAIEYPGGGGIPGQASETGLKADALTAYDWLAARHDGPIVVHGYSMGTGLAVHVAARREVAAVILDAPYVRMCELMTRASYLPACYMPFVQKWDTARDVPRVTAPVLIQHGESDQLIPPANGARLADLFSDAGVRVSLQVLPGGTHNNLAGHPDYRENISGFLAQAVVVPPE
ncbi:alpha/beta hydrolase [Yoonia sp.]|uniref:alpha/beta hydrolase n=1 Tax=Yoonia sp. TaxID=2212373 RepID=UPI002FD8E119